MTTAKKRWIRGIAAAATAALCTIPLSACSSNSGGAAGNGKDTVAISFYSYFKKDQIGKVVDEFQKENPNIKVDVQYAQDSAQYIETLQTRLAGGEPPTIFNIIMDNRTDIIDANLALDLSGGKYLDGIKKENFTLFSKDDKVYGMPVSAWVSGMFYNTDIMKEAGISKLPETWEEFIEAGKKVVAKGKTAYLEDFNTQPSATIEGLLASHYAKAGVAEKDEIVYSGKSTYEKEWTPVLSDWKKAIDAGVLPQKSIGLSGDQVKQEFITGNLFAMRSGPWDLNDMRQSGVKFKIGAIPGYEGHQWIGGGPDQGFAIAAKADPKKQEAAKTFLTFLNSKKGLQTFTEAAGTLSLSDKFKSETPAELKEVVEKYFMTNQFYWVTFPKAPAAMTNKMVTSQQELAQGKIDPQQFAKAMDEEASKVSK